MHSDLKTSATTIRLLRTDEEYEAAVSEIDRLLDLDPPASGVDADRLDVLSLMVEAYDDEHHALPGQSTPQSVVLFMLEQHGKSKADLVTALGSKSRVSEFLAGKRRLSLSQIGSLRREFGIPADLLIPAEPDEVPLLSSTVSSSVRVREEPPSSLRPNSSDDVAALSALVREMLGRVDSLTETVAEQARQNTAMLRSVCSSFDRQTLILQQVAGNSAAEIALETSGNVGALVMRSGRNTPTSAQLGQIANNNFALKA
jgi:HTH-type transcriptional regulator/antitoxin HigA